MSKQKKKEPGSLKAIKLLVIIAIVFTTSWFVSRSPDYEAKLKVRELVVKSTAQSARQLELKLDRVHEELNITLEDKNSSVEKQTELENEKLRLEEELKKTQAQLQAKLDAKNKASSSTAYAGAPITGNKQAWLAASNIPEADWAYADWLITRESSWNPHAQNPRSTAYGLKQFLDGTWAGVGCEKSSEPVYQLNCGQKYVMARYKSWANAKAFWQSHRWY